MVKGRETQILGCLLSEVMMRATSCVMGRGWEGGSRRELSNKTKGIKIVIREG